MSRVVALSGFIGSGKDTVAKVLVQEYGYVQFAFADALKDVCVAIFGWDRALMDGKSPESRAWRETVDPWWSDRLGIPNLTPRWAMQNVGSILRDNLCEDIWIATVERKIAALAGDRILVSDARYFNELDTVRRLGAKIIRVRRGADPVWFETAVRANTAEDSSVRAAERDLMKGFHIHDSEWCWIGYAFDRVIENDGSLQDLHDAVRGIVDA